MFDKAEIKWLGGSKQLFDRDLVKLTHPELLKEARSIRELHKLKARITLLAKVFANNPYIKVVPNPNPGWACGVNPEVLPTVYDYLEGRIDSIDHLSNKDIRGSVILYDVNEIGTWEDKRVYGVITHEVGHAIHTDYKLWFKHLRFAKDQNSLPSAMALLQNTLEDCWINNREFLKSSERYDQLQALYYPLLGRTISSLPSMPIYSQYCYGIIVYWALGEFPTNVSNRVVQDAFTKTKDSIDQYILAKSSKMTDKILIEKIWPVARQLLEESFDIGARELYRSETIIRPRGRNVLVPNSNGEGYATIFVPDPQQPEVVETPISYDNLPSDKKVSLRERARYHIDSRISKDANESGLKGIRFDRTNNGILNMPVFDTFDENQNVDSLFEKVINDIDEQIMALINGNDIDFQNAASKKESLERERKHREMVKSGFDPSTEEALFDRYNNLEQLVKPKIIKFLNQIRKFLPKKEDSELDGSFYTGTKLNMDILMERIPIDDFRIYSRRHLTHTDEVKMYVELLIDNSGSMRGQKINQSLMTAIFWAYVLEALDVPFSITGFGNSLLEIKNPGQHFNSSKSQIKKRLIQMLNASMDSTDMGTPLEFAYQRISKTQDRDIHSLKAIFVISDSGANLGLTGENLKLRISQYQRDTIVYNIILTTNNEEIRNAKELFGDKNVLAPRNFEDLPDEAAILLRLTLNRLWKNRKR